jgi:hypothetical protein
MNNLAIRRYETLKRVRDFGAVRITAFPDGSYGRELFEKVTNIVNDLQSHGADQTAGRGEASSKTTTKAAVREELREVLMAINRTARVLAFKTKGLDDKFRFPHNATDQALLNAARAFATAAEPLKAEFIKREHAADFIDQLNGLINSFEDASTQQSVAKGSRVAARVAIDETISQGLQTIRELDAIIRNKFVSDAQTLAAWEQASHIERRTRTVEAEKAGKESSPTTPAPQS